MGRDPDGPDPGGANLSLAEEQGVLDATLDALGREEAELSRRKRFWSAMMDSSNPAEPAMASGVAWLHSNIVQVVRGDQSPYYGRFDVVEDKRDAAESYYLSKTLHLHDTTKSGGSFIIHWTSPMAGACVAQGPRVQAAEFRGEALLKRRFRFEDRGSQRIARLYDDVLRYASTEAGTPELGGDAFLQDVLRVAGPRARSIVASIAEEQDSLVRESASGTLVIDGVPDLGRVRSVRCAPHSLSPT